MEGENLRRKARKKYLSNSLAAGLVRVPESTLRSQYAKTFACCDVLAVSGLGDITSNFYCKNRWCRTCASIKMATMINKYLPIMERIPDLYFVTLTLRTVAADQITDRIEWMQQCWRKITNQARRDCPGFVGLRKTELKIGRGGGYHGHYHILVSGEDNASFIIRQWLRLNPKQASRSAQDMRKVNPDGLENALLELFKYATKSPESKDSCNNVDASFRQLDCIFRALYKRRVYQPFGGLRAINEDDFELTPESVKRAAGIYKWIGHDWFHVEFGQQLTGWTPESEDINLID